MPLIVSLSSVLAILGPGLIGVSWVARTRPPATFIASSVGRIELLCWNRILPLFVPRAPAGRQNPAGRGSPWRKPTAPFRSRRRLGDRPASIPIRGRFVSTLLLVVGRSRRARRRLCEGRLAVRRSLVFMRGIDDLTMANATITRPEWSTVIDPVLQKELEQHVLGDLLGQAARDGRHGLQLGPAVEPLAARASAWPAARSR